MTGDHAPDEMSAALAAAPPEARADFIAFVYLMAQRQGATAGLVLAPETNAALVDFAERAHLAEAATPEKRAELTVSYFDAHPLDSTLLTALAECVKQSALRGSDGDRRGALAFLGAAPRPLPAPQPDRTQPRQLPFQVAKDFQRKD